MSRRAVAAALAAASLLSLLWLFPGWKATSLTLGTGGHSINEAPEAELIASRAALRARWGASGPGGRCGHGPCPWDQGNFLLYDYLTLRLPITPRKPVIDSFRVERDVVQIVVAYRGETACCFRPDQTRTDHWQLTMRTRNGLIAGRPVVITLLPPAGERIETDRPPGTVWPVTRYGAPEQLAAEVGIALRLPAGTETGLAALTQERDGHQTLIWDYIQSGRVVAAGRATTLPLAVPEGEQLALTPGVTATVADAAIYWQSGAYFCSLTAPGMSRASLITLAQAHIHE